MNAISLMAALGAFSMGAVAAYITIDRTLSAMPIHRHAKPLLVVWVFAFWAGTVADAIFSVGLTILPWLAAGLTTGGLTRLAIAEAQKASKNFH